MKSIIAKLMIVGLLVAAVLSFCPLVLPGLNQLVALPVVKKPKPVAPPPGVRHLPGVEDLVFEMTNRARQVKGLSPLKKDDELTNIAQAYSDDMLVRHFFDHTTPNGVSFDERIMDHYPHRVFLVGENIWSASGYYSRNAQKLAKLIVDDWMSSPGHRENMLSPSFNRLGVGVSAEDGRLRATQEFVGRLKIPNFAEFIRPWVIKANKL